MIKNRKLNNIEDEIKKFNNLYLQRVSKLHAYIIISSLKLYVSKSHAYIIIASLNLYVQKCLILEYP